MARWCGCDAGALECSLVPYGVDEVFTASARDASANPPERPFSQQGMFGLDCVRVAEPTCCLPPNAPMPYAPCSWCNSAPATIVDIPCGHVNSCAMCVNRAKASQCPRCRKPVESKVDVSNFVDKDTGAPQKCNICRTARAHMVMLPCAHMSFCRGCLPKQVAGCPSCGAEVERVVFVNWGAQPMSARGGSCFAATVRPVPAVEVPGDLDDCGRDADAAMRRLEQQLMHLKNLKR